jgi:hypothetical protein
MKIAKKLIDRINAEYIYSIYQIEDEIDMDGVVEVATIDRDEHRWYTLGTKVFSVEGEFFGVRGPISLKSESMGWDDIGVRCEAFTMHQTPSVTYVRG